jgi:hypothetical protein
MQRRKEEQKEGKRRNKGSISLPFWLSDTSTSKLLVIACERKGNSRPVDAFVYYGVYTFYTFL